MKARLHDRMEVVYEDTDLIVIDKSAGVLSYPVEGKREEAAIQLVRRYWKATRASNHHLYLLHRLDAETSGLMVFAKTTLAREALLSQFEKHTVLRSYVAVTWGIPGKKQGRIHTMLGRNFTGRRAVTSRGREAITDYRMVKTNPVRNRSLIRCRLQTGRTHQVRIHLAHIGAPVLGDPVYGAKQHGRLMLHAEALGFIHPRTHRTVVFRTSLPRGFRLAL
jgi:23S rRNA pseudouridine1911/1915/1917 synthase